MKLAVSLLVNHKLIKCFWSGIHKWLQWPTSNPLLTSSCLADSNQIFIRGSCWGGERARTKVCEWWKLVVNIGCHLMSKESTDLWQGTDSMRNSLYSIVNSLPNFLMDWCKMAGCIKQVAEAAAFSWHVSDWHNGTHSQVCWRSWEQFLVQHSVQRCWTSYSTLNLIPMPAVGSSLSVVR